jgi:hypothetical protein
MGREVRRVKHGWSHPRDERGNFIPLFGTPFLVAWTEWEIGRPNFEKGRRAGFLGAAWEPAPEDCSWKDWAGTAPRPEEHMPAEAFGDWYLMYETYSEGTPVTESTVPMATAHTLALYLVRAEASFFGGMTTTYEHWLAIGMGKDRGLPVFTRKFVAGSDDPGEAP